MNSVVLHHLRLIVTVASTGLRNPFVKFKTKGKLIHRSQTFCKSLNPRWVETFSVRIKPSPVGGAVAAAAGDVTSRRPLTSVRVVVRDNNFGQFNEYMGEAEIDTSQLMPNE
jgi:Ca2+-dependent lipid-binding protein